MPLFVHEVIRVKHHESTFSIRVVKVWIVGTTAYKNMVKVGNELIPLEEYLGD